MRPKGTFNNSKNQNWRSLKFQGLEGKTEIKWKLIFNFLQHRESKHATNWLHEKTAALNLTEINKVARRGLWTTYVLTERNAELWQVKPSIHWRGKMEDTDWLLLKNESKCSATKLPLSIVVASLFFHFPAEFDRMLVGSSAEKVLKQFVVSHHRSLLFKRWVHFWEPVCFNTDWV